MNIKKHTKLWYGDEVRNVHTGRQGIIQKFYGNAGGGLVLVLKGDKLGEHDDTDVNQWVLVKKNQPGSDKPYKFLRNISEDEYEPIKELVAQCNEKLFPGAISVSKVPRDTDSLFRAFGSIWYSCTWQELSEFNRICCMRDREKVYGITRMSKDEIIALPAGQKYFMMYVDNANNNGTWSSADVIECIKIANKKPDELLTWNEARDRQFDECRQDMGLIASDGSFIPSHDDGNRDETGYLYKAIPVQSVEVEIPVESLPSQGEHYDFDKVVVTAGASNNE